MAAPQHELWAEAIRDIGILLLVFVPIDIFLPNVQFTTRRVLIALGFVIFGLLLIQIGVKMGSERKP